MDRTTAIGGNGNNNPLGGSNPVPGSAKAVENAAMAAHQTVDKVAQAAHPAAEWIGDSAERLKQTQDQMVTSTRDYIRERPLVTLGIALAAGYLIGRLAR